MASVPECLSPGAVVPCWLCGDPLHQAANEHTDEFVWVGEDGRQTATSADLRPLAQYGGAYARLAWLDRALTGAMAAAGGPHGKKASLTPLFWARAREYSMLKVRLEMGMTFHIHQVRSDDTPRYQGPDVRCCGWPGWLRPSGWWCRKCGRRLGGTLLGVPSGGS